MSSNNNGNTREDLMTELKIKLRQWQRWCNSLEINASKPAYSDDDIAKLRDLRNHLDNGKTFDNAVAEITGKPDQKPTDYRSGLTQRYGSKLQTEAKAVGAALAQAFDQMVWDEFVLAIGNSKPTHFEQSLANYSITSAIDVLDVEILGALEGEYDA